MAKKWIIIIGVFAAAVAAIVVAYYYLWPEESNLFIVGKKNINPPAATGDIDDAVDAFLKETVDIGNTVLGGKDDASLLDEDSQEINGFSQSYNENEL